ncbi:hypothetical protein AVEN_11353-1 [Araneus ventricosus]|uniref:Uncharacterized protein n=1 Tax=Araneus ventricosus TaxID=182803 RepID=A0A4Y2HC72_ARAVE|nr:hypothetical protein AVEN_11353-1 [Araneus ventricosus]
MDGLPRLRAFNEGKGVPPFCSKEQVETSFVQIRGWDQVPHRGRSGKPVGIGSVAHFALHPPPATRPQSALVVVRILYEFNCGFCFEKR